MSRVPKNRYDGDGASSAFPEIKRLRREQGNEQATKSRSSPRGRSKWKFAIGTNATD
jgi:hypothetical protein